MNQHFILIFFFFFNTMITQGQSDALLIQNINYIDVITGKAKKGSILIEEGKITSINKKIKTKDNDNIKTLDGTGKWMIPGLVDAHIHLFQSGGIYTRPDALDLRKFRNYTEERNWLIQNAPDLLKRYLKAGITTVIDMGGPFYNLKIRDLYNDPLQFPNLWITGPLVSTYQPPEFMIQDTPIRRVKSTEEARALVQQQLPYQPDFIKIWYITLPTQSAESTYDIVAATIDEAHKNGLKAAVHATELNTAKLALKAGADILVHSAEGAVDEDFIRLLKTNKATYIPTLMVHGALIKSLQKERHLNPLDFSLSNPIPLGSMFDRQHYPPDNLLEEYQQYLPDMVAELKDLERLRGANLKQLHDAGITIATGSDAGNIGTFHTSSFFQELEYMSKAGLSNAAILRASTINGAKVLDKLETGSIEIGKTADLVILNTNPLDDLKALQEVDFVIKNGHLMAVDTILKASPEQLAQEQLNGYNARNIEAFLAPYSEDVEVYNFPHDLQYKGKETMRKNYSQMFENIPKLHCQLVNRMVLENTVIDQERVTGFNREEPLEVMAIYKIENNKIAKVYFIQ